MDSCHSIVAADNYSFVEHLDDFISDISSLFQRPQLSDLTLVIENQEVRVNRSILAARCEYFHALLFNGMRESNLQRIELHSVDLKSFKLILKYIYSGKLSLINLNSEELASLLISARFFSLKKLVCDIASYLTEPRRCHINKNNVWLLYKVAKQFCIGRLAKACEIYFDNNAELILQHEEFLNLEVEELKEMVNRDSFFAPEKAILRAICNYYRNNIARKTGDQCTELLKELLEPVRLSLLSISEIKLIFGEFELPKCGPGMEPCHNNNDIINNSPDHYPRQINSISPQDQHHHQHHAHHHHNHHHQHHHQQQQLQQQQQQRSITVDCPTPIKNPKSIKRLKLSLPVYTVDDEIKGNLFTQTCEELEDKDLACSKHNHLTTQRLLEITNCMRQRKETIRGYLVYDENIATKEYKVEPIKGRLKKDLVCSTDRNYNIRTCTNHTMPYFGSTREEYIQVAFGRPFIVNNIRMLLLDDGQRSFSYIIEVSVDGRIWSKVIDYSRYWCRSWQHLFFKERVVKHVRITGTRSQFYGTGSSTMSVVYFDCMYNTLDDQMYNLTDDGCRLFKTKKGSREYFIEPKSTIVEMTNTIALTSSSNGTMRHFRLRAKGNSSSSITANSTVPTSPNPHLPQGLSSPTDTSYSKIGANTIHNGSPLTNPVILQYRTTDFARGSANWNGPGKVIFQFAQPFKIGSFAFNIVPSGGSTRSQLSYNVSISNDLERGSWKFIKEIVRVGSKDLTVVEFEPEIVTFIEIRSVDYPNLSIFSVKQFECPYIKHQDQQSNNKIAYIS